MLRLSSIEEFAAMETSWSDAMFKDLHGLKRLIRSAAFLSSSTVLCVVENMHVFKGPVASNEHGYFLRAIVFDKLRAASTHW